MLGIDWHKDLSLGFERKSDGKRMVLHHVSAISSIYNTSFCITVKIYRFLNIRFKHSCLLSEAYLDYPMNNSISMCNSGSQPVGQNYLGGVKYLTDVLHNRYLHYDS